MTFTHALSSNNYGPFHIIVSTSPSNGTHTTLAAAVAAASSGDTIYVRDGTYTENITLKSGVSIVALSMSADEFSAGQVVIIGKFIDNGVPITADLIGLQLQTNSDYILSVTSGSVVGLYGCSLYATNHALFNMTNSSGNITLKSCSGDFSSANGLCTNTSGNFYLFDCNFRNTGNSTVQGTLSDGGIFITNTMLPVPIATSSTGAITVRHSMISTQNAVVITTAGTGTCLVEQSIIEGGSAQCITVGAGTTASVYNTTLSSSNTSVIDGAGALNYSGLSFSGSSSKLSTTTQTGGLLKGGVTQNPSLAFIGQQIESVVASPGVSINNATETDITSITLTAGIWDVTGLAMYAGATTGTLVRTTVGLNSGTVGTSGNNTTSLPFSSLSAIDIACIVPRYRIFLSAATTTVYLVGRVNYTVGSATGYGRLSATRVG